MILESEVNLTQNFKEKIVFTSSSSLIKRIVIIYRIQQFNNKNLSKMFALHFLTKEENGLILCWTPSFDKKFGKVTIFFEKGTRKVVIMLRNMMEIKINDKYFN